MIDLWGGVFGDVFGLVFIIDAGTYTPPNSVVATFYSNLPTYVRHT